MIKRANTIKRKVTERTNEQVPNGVSFYIVTKIGHPSYFETFAKICVRDFVEGLFYLQDFMHNFFNKKIPVYLPRLKRLKKTLGMLNDVALCNKPLFEDRGVN